MAKHPTIHDVASRAGVSKSLVSLVMRGASNVSEGRRTGVLTAVRDLGYRPNLAAGSLVRRRSQLGELVAGREALAIETLLELRVDGVILGSPRVPRAFVAEVASSVATIALGFTARTDTYDTIAGDERVGVTSVIAHLVELGHSRIAHVHGSGPGARPRRAQYERAMARHGLERHVRVAAGDFTEAGGASGMRTLMESGSTWAISPSPFSSNGSRKGDGMPNTSYCRRGSLPGRRRVRLGVERSREGVDSEWQTH